MLARICTPCLLDLHPMPHAGADLQSVPFGFAPHAGADLQSVPFWIYNPCSC